MKTSMNSTSTLTTTLTTKMTSRIARELARHSAMAPSAPRASSASRPAPVAAGMIALGLALGGCAATNLSARPTVADRQETIVTGESPRLLVTGPARLLHVDLSGEGDVDVRLYRVFVGTSSRTDEACRSAQPISPILLHAEQSHRLNLDVPPGQSVCVAAIHSPHSPQSTKAAPLELAWHAERAGHSTHEHLDLGMLQASAR
jgi:hypothetical protein